MDQASAAFWQRHSLHFLEMALTGDHRERLRHPDGYGARSRDCGDRLEIFLSVSDDRIDRITFETNGCLNTVACANTLIRLAEGKSVAEVWEITSKQIIDYLETLPVSEHHCADLAVVALHLALASLSEKRNAPWKKFYRSTD